MSNLVLECEIEALQSIYEDNIRVERYSDAELVDIIYSEEEFQISFTCSSKYPDESPKVSCGILRKLHLMDPLTELIHAMVGSEVIYTAIDFVKGRLEDMTAYEEPLQCMVDLTRDNNGNNEGVSVTVSDTTMKANPLEMTLYHGEVTTEKRSAFQAHFAYVHSMEEVDEFRGCILGDKRFSRATHNIFAYRFESPDTHVVFHDSDDDGETAAGGRVAELLRLMGVTGVAVIVSRWFGGVLLGPDRFKFINNSARNLLELHGMGATDKGPQSSNSRLKKKPR
jgi:putative IMPACT (imprinted ancient) family translation regulator